MTDTNDDLRTTTSPVGLLDDDSGGHVPGAAADWQDGPLSKSEVPDRLLLVAAGLRGR